MAASSFFRVEPFLDGKQKTFGRVVSPEMYPFSLDNRTEPKQTMKCHSSLELIQVLISSGYSWLPEIITNNTLEGSTSNNTQ